MIIAPKRLSLRTSNLTSMFPVTIEHEPLNIFQKGAWLVSCHPPKIFGCKIYANSPKRVKATDFKFDMHVSRYSPDMTSKFFGKGSVCKSALGGDMHSHERLLVLPPIFNMCSTC